VKSFLVIHRKVAPTLKIAMDSPDEGEDRLQEIKPGGDKTHRFMVYPNDDEIHYEVVWEGDVVALTLEVMVGDTGAAARTAVDEMPESIRRHIEGQSR